MTDLMVDLETLGDNHNSVILQIGAIYFNRDTGEIGEKMAVNIDIQSCLRHGLSVTGKTLQWWFQKSKEAQTAVTCNPIKLEVALNKYNQFSMKAKAVWCHATFDQVILINAMTKVGIKPNVNYKMVRDIRTIVDLAKIDITKYKLDGIHHNALDDCLFQIKYTVDAIKILIQKKPEVTV